MSGFLPPWARPAPVPRWTEDDLADTDDRLSLAAFAPAVAPTTTGRRLGLAVDAVTSADEFAAISVPAGDLVTNGRIAKFLIDRRTPGQRRVWFVNANFGAPGLPADATRYHYSFAQAVLGISESLPEFNQATYFTQQKRYVAGVVHSYAYEGGTLYGLQFYPQDVIAEETILDAVTAVAAQLRIPGARTAFVATGTQQTTATIGDRLAAAGIEQVPLDKVLGALDYLPLNLGEAWGYLRIFPRDLDALRPTDIPVFDELPLDLSVVAGVLTRAVQDTNSHVNLKSKERGTPNAVLRSALPSDPRLQPFADQPVHYVVRADRFILEPTTPEIVAAKQAERLRRPLVTLEVEPETEVRSYDELAGGSPRQTLGYARRYGSKATNLAFLAHRNVLGRTTDGGSASARLGYDLVPRGLAVPMQYYRDFVALPANATLKAAIDALVAAERAGELSAADLLARVGEIQAGFLAGVFPPGQLAAIRAKLNQVLPGLPELKVRSSANAEDVPNFDGAGLHDSFAADPGKTDSPTKGCRFDVETAEPARDPNPDSPATTPEPQTVGGPVKRKVKPKSLACAIRGVYAGLWNKRAVEERAFARIDQSSAAMGLAIVSAYDNEEAIAANAVVVTRVLNTMEVYGYSLSIQRGNDLVTNPDPGTHSEVTIAGFLSDEEPISLTVTRFAQPEPGGAELTTPVLDRGQVLAIVDLTKVVERAYCSAKPDYYPGPCADVPADNLKPTALDLELKVLASGRLVLKQVREFGGS